MSYGISLTEVYQQLGAYAGRILKGAKLIDLPIVRSVTFEKQPDHFLADFTGSVHSLGGDFGGIAGAFEPCPAIGKFVLRTDTHLIREPNLYWRA